MSADHHSTGPEERHGEDVQQDDRQTAAGEGAGGTLSYCQHRAGGEGGVWGWGWGASCYPLLLSLTN